jgi:hypothetical protein
MNDHERHTSAVARCEAAARNHGDALGGVWYPVSDQLHASLCEVCGAMAWVTQSSYEKRWRRSGSALKDDCSEDDWRLAAGD